VLRKWPIGRSKLILVSALLLLVAGGCTSPFITINEKRITVELADTPAERARGLMFRESLCETCGMLFVFEEEGKYSFWMKNTLLPLDMIFIDSDGVIADILSAEPCRIEPCERYAPSREVLYVLEVNKGVSAEHSFAVGQKVTLRLPE